MFTLVLTSLVLKRATIIVCVQEIWRAQSMHVNRAQEQLSFAYITAVASQAQVQVELRRLDDDGIDGCLIWDQGTEPTIDFQAKSTASDVVKPDHIAYPLNVSNYNRLVKLTTTPRILIVMVVPDCIDQWTDPDHDRLLTRYAAYWHNLRGEPETGNKNTKTVHIPKHQILSAAAVANLIEQADAGGFDDD